MKNIKENIKDSVKKYLNTAGFYCAHKSEEIRENYKFERFVKPGLDRKLKIKADSIIDEFSFIIINRRAV